MKKSSLIAIVLFLFWNNLFCQYDQKYWNYRERFRKYFTVIGSGQGESNVLVIRNGKMDNVEAGSTEIRIGNQVMNLGDYIAMLAMEYKILSEAGQSVSQTAKELYYALYAFNRLDYVAETHFGMAAELNGYFNRDDVYSGTDFVSSHSVLNNGLADLSTCPQTKAWYCDYITGSGAVQWVEHTPYSYWSSGFQFPSDCSEIINDTTLDTQEDFRKTDLMSPDEVVGLFFGMAMVVKCVPSTANYNNMAMNDADGNVNFVDAARNITDRVAIRMRDDGWDIKSPTGCTLFSGPEWMKYAYAIAAGEIMGEHNKYRGSMSGIGWCAIDPFFDVCEWYDGCDQAINMKITCMLAAIGDSWDCVGGILQTTYERIVDHTSHLNNWKYFYPLIYTVLHGGSNSIAQSEVETLLASAPNNGPFNHNTANNPNDYGSNGWCTDFLFRMDNEEQQCVDADGKATRDPGNYTGLDYMLLYNLYLLSPPPLTPPPPNCTVSLEQPDKVYNVSQNITGTEEIHFKNSITTQSGKNIIIKSGADVWWTAGNFIELNEGFETEDGATAVFEIIQCNELFGRMANPDTSHTYTKAQSEVSASKDGKVGSGSGSNPKTKSKQPLANKSEISNQQSAISGSASLPTSNLQSALTVTPNPSTGGKFNLICTLQDVGCMDAEISVMNMLGEIIHKEPFKKYAFHTEIDLSNQPKGTYFVKIQNGETALVYKVVAQ